MMNPFRQALNYAADADGLQHKLATGMYIDDDDDIGCEMCAAPLNDGINSEEECSLCAWSGCQKCMVRWDDLYPYLCDECAERMNPATVPGGGE